MKHIRGAIRDMSIGLKIPLLGCLLLVLALISVTLIDMTAWHKETMRYMTEISEKKNHLVAQRICEMLDNAENMSALIAYNNNIQTNLPIDNVRSQMETEYTLRNFIEHVLDNSIGVSNIVLYRANGGMVASNYTNAHKLVEADFERQFEKMLNKNSSCVWTNMHDSDYSIFPSERAAVTLYRNIISLYTGQRVGMMAINVNEFNLAKCYLEEQSEDTRILILDGDSRIVSSSDKEQLYKSFSEIGTVRGNEFVSGNGQCMFSSVPVGKLNWTIIRLDRYDTIMANYFASLRFRLIASMSVMIVMGILTFYFTRRIIAPIIEWRRAMDNVEVGDEAFLKNVEHNSKDEIGCLINSFNNMQRRISILIERIKFEQKQKSKLEILTLQTQIKPHFLYNTLESVCALVQMTRNDDAIQMLKSIESFYRGSLSKGSYQITLAEEINILRQYVQIQSYRYFGKLDVSYYISQDMEDCLIPKLTLQPLVENAIYHGLKNGGRDGKIEIRERHDGETIILTVSDNGDGFNVTASQQRGAQDHGYGISNVQSSIQSCFGAAYGVYIQSQPGKGTTVFIRIPIHRRGENGERR